MPQSEFEPAQNLSSGFNEWRCAVVIAATPLRNQVRMLTFYFDLFLKKIEQTHV